MILNKIVEKKLETLEIQKLNFPLPILLANIHNLPKPSNFYDAMAKRELSIIGEIKQSSPSKGVLREQLNIEDIVRDYSNSVHGISILTEEHFFKGSPKYLKDVSTMTSLPLLRKDFIIDPYQIYESKYLGASCILLIASILALSTLKSYNALANSLGMDTIIEVHTKEEITKALSAGAKIIGINNRNLNDFTIDINKTVDLRKYIPKNILVISESGINTATDIQLLRQSNIDGVLIGESFMKSDNIEKKARELIAAYDTPN